MIQLLLIALFSFLAQLILPWWSIAIVAFMICFWRSRRADSALGEGFLGIALVWLAYALLIHLRTEGVFTSRMGLLLLKSTSPLWMLVITPFLGGLVGGIAGIAGYYIRQAILPSQQFAMKRR